MQLYIENKLFPLRNARMRSVELSARGQHQRTDNAKSTLRSLRRRTCSTGAAQRETAGRATRDSRAKSAVARPDTRAYAARPPHQQVRIAVCEGILAKSAASAQAFKLKRGAQWWWGSGSSRRRPRWFRGRRDHEHRAPPAVRLFGQCGRARLRLRAHRSHATHSGLLNQQRSR